MHVSTISQVVYMGICKTLLTFSKELYSESQHADMAGLFGMCGYSSLTHFYQQAI